MNFYPPIKRILGFVFALLGLMVCSPLFLIIPLLVKIFSPQGPAFFVQKRVGKDNKIFTMYKFRSLLPEAVGLLKREVPLQKLPIPVIGKTLRITHLDEVPQLLNILKGEMSFIGPRPFMPETLSSSAYTNEELKERAKVRPGLSGLAQTIVYLKEEQRKIEPLLIQTAPLTKLNKHFPYDLYYVRNLSFLLDCKIFLISLYLLFKRLFEIVTFHKIELTIDEE